MNRIARTKFMVRSRRNALRNLRNRRRKLDVERLESRSLLAGDLDLVQDINTQINAGYLVPSGYEEPAMLGTELYFIADVQGYGEELWKTDGTDTGTKLVKDIVPGVGSSEPSNLTVAHDELFFTASQPDYFNTQLWKSDGTTAGTVLLKDFGMGDYDRYIRQLVASNFGVFFTYQPSIDDSIELWYSNGTAVGTYVVADQSFGFETIASAVSSGGVLFFSGQTSTYGRELWRSDGTPEGTFLVKDIRPGADSSYPYELTAFQGGVIFSANLDTNNTGTELWRSDGTADGTIQVIDLQPGSAGSNPNDFFVAGDQVIFSATTDTVGEELWLTDGTSAGTILIGDLNPGPDSSSPRDFTPVGTSTLYFVAKGHGVGSELWVLDADGARFVKDVYPGDNSSFPSELVGVGNILYFDADDGVHGRELWRSDGTDGGTWMVEDVGDGNYSGPGFLTNISGVLFFEQYDPDLQTSVLRYYDGFSPKTNVVVFSWAPDANAYPYSFTDVNGVAYFTANDHIHGTELWKSTGPGGEVVMVKDINPNGFDSSWPDYLSELNGLLYFIAWTPGVPGEAYRSNLWKSDGTSDGTVQVFGSQVVSEAIGEVQKLKVVGDKMFFASNLNSSTLMFDLWISDGTQFGTTKLGKFRSDSKYYLDYELESIVEYQGEYYFAANDGVVGQELWKTDGTPEGTVVVSEVSPGPSWSSPDRLTLLNDKLYFVNYAAEDKIGLWVTDGSTEGTKEVRSFQYPTSGPYYVSPLSELVVANGNLYFQGYDLGTGSELWKSDGTPDGTVLVADSIPGSEGISPHFLMSDGMKVYFAGNTPENGMEPWVSDGTSANTKMILDVWPGPMDGINTSNDYYYYYEDDAAVVANGKIYFVANEGVHGEEPWVSDGTVAGTKLVKDIIPGSGGSAPYGLTQVGDMLFMSAGHSSYGTEPFAMSLTAVPPVAANDSAVTQAGFAFAIPVLANDSTPEGQLNPGSVTIVSNPTLGSATANTDGTITFVPPTTGNGTTTFTYHVKNNSDVWSNIASVTVTWQQSIFQNPTNKYDVDKDGDAWPLDVLRLIDEINRNGTRQLPPQSGYPSYFYDVNGDRSLDPLDVLEVINYINRGKTGGEGESSSIDSVVDSIWSQMGAMPDDESLFGTSSGKKKGSR
ncbi:MAG: ELWxxDGT repeat protein [Pirellula sp.]